MEFEDFQDWNNASDCGCQSADKNGDISEQANGKPCESE